jgi:hypothetical protein
MKKILMSIGGFLIGYFIIATAFGAIRALNHGNSDGGLSPQANINTQRNATVNNCINGPTKVTLSAAQLASYCGCSIDKLHAIYGDGIYTDAVYWNNVNAQGFNQTDTAAMQDCLKAVTGPSI